MDTAFELLTHENEQEVVMSYVREEAKLYAEKNPLDAKKRLYDILRGSKEGTPTHQRILSLLQAIRYPSASMKVPKIEDMCCSKLITHFKWVAGEPEERTHGGAN
ncbi:MAG: hypothetical protein V1850_01995 [Candidatus Bathyarchaeota archaeon]